MSLLQITEPSKTHKEKTIKSLGIDFGTTNCVCTIYDNQKFININDRSGKKIIPSVIFFEDEKFYVGNEALDHRNFNYENAIYSVKRLLINEPSRKKIKLKNGISISPFECCIIIFKYLKAMIENKINEKINKCVITVPAYFDEISRSVIKKSAIKAGFNVMRLINEPTAAALAYGLEKNIKGNYLVYDLGGGTFDVSVLKLTDGVFQVLSTGGDSNLGGDDIDFSLANLICQKLNFKNLNKFDHSAKLTLLQKCKFFKENFNRETYEIDFSFLTKDLKYKISSSVLFDSAEPIINKTINITEKVLVDANLQQNEIDGFIFVGGSTKLNYLKKKIKNSFNFKFYDDMNPELLVSFGAAAQADSLINGSHNLLLDVTPLSLGIETVGNLMEKIIDRNTQIPVIKEQEFTTFENGQTAIKIHVLQGERELCEDNKSLGKFILSGIEPKPAGIPRIKVQFYVDSDGILEVTAVDNASGVEKKIEVKPTKQLNLDDMTKILRESVEKSQEDLSKRSIQESIIEGQRVIKEIKFNEKEINKICDIKITKKIKKLVLLLEIEILNKNKDKIYDLIEGLNELTKDFAEKKIEIELKSAMVGKKINSLENQEN